MQTSRLLSFSSNSPSFGSFSSTVDLAAIAARVVDEFHNQEPPPPPPPPESDSHNDDFEFAFDTCSPQPIATADEIFSNGQIRPLNPYGYGGGIQNAPVESNSTVPKRRRPALGKLMSEDRDPSSNSEEAEEDLIGVSPETYCVWTPKQSNDDLQGLTSSPSRSKIKSNSAGFSKRWKLRNLLYARSNSEGNEKLVFPAPVKKNDDDDDRKEKEETTLKEESEETKRQEFVPYKKDMIGIMKNVNGLSRHLRPF